MTAPTTGTAFENPPLDCPLCPRLVQFREDNKKAYPDFHNAPVPSFGPIGARVFVVGLAPGLKGANWSGRPFTGDWAGDLLYPTLVKFGLAKGEYGRHPDDGLKLTDCRIANAVRCVPPQNKPIGQEINACRPFLVREFAAMPNLRAIIALGRIAHEAVIRTNGLKPSGFKFAHGAVHDLGGNDKGGRYVMYDSYHCSRYNTNTGRLTTEMFEEVFAAATKGF